MSVTNLRSVVVTSYARTPFGSFLGSLSGLSAPQLGSIAIGAAIQRSRIRPDDVEEVIMGHVLQAGCGQAPARQAALGAEIPTNVDVWSLNKVCSSGLKAIAMASQAIATGSRDLVVAGGMESMSNAPHLLSKARSGGYRYGHGQLTDTLLHDGLWDPYNDMHMGQCCEKSMKDMGITRAESDAYAIESYRRATEAWKSGAIAPEVVPVPVKNGKGGEISVAEDEDFKKMDADKVAKLKPAFLKDSSATVTAANASNLNDGAAAVVLMSEGKAQELGLQPLGRILSYADAAVDPVDFSIAPAEAARCALKKAGLQTVDYYEYNEAFSGVALANMKLTGAPHDRVNVHGGAVALGHPIGASGARIFMSLVNVLRARKGTTGLAAICNGGGGATAMVVSALGQRSAM